MRSGSIARFSRNVPRFVLGSTLLSTQPPSFGNRPSWCQPAASGPVMSSRSAQDPIWANEMQIGFCTRAPRKEPYHHSFPVGLGVIEGLKPPPRPCNHWGSTSLRKGQDGRDKSNRVSFLIKQHCPWILTLLWAPINSLVTEANLMGFYHLSVEES